MRLDQYLVENGYFNSKSKAQQAIIDGKISVNNKIVTKKSFSIDAEDVINIVGELLPFVSRGGSKLEKAINDFKINLAGKTIVDIGSSTGGFTDCALQNDALKVIAVDVGKNQFNYKLLENGKVELHESTDFRNLDANYFKDATLAVIDVSFISAAKMLPKLNENLNITEIILLLKPQFECGKEFADQYRGVVLNPSLHEDIINTIFKLFNAAGFYPQNITFSPIRGGSGNIEYLVYFNRSENTSYINPHEIVQSAFSYFNINARTR